MQEVKIQDSHRQVMEVHRHELLMVTGTTDMVGNHVLTHTGNVTHGGELI